MIYLLMLLLIIVFIFALVFSQGDILSPWVISCSMFIFSTGIFLLNVEKWGTDYNLITIVVIIAALIFWGLGEMFSRVCIEGRNTNSIGNLKSNIKPIFIRKNTIYIISIIMLVILILDFKITYELSIISGNPGGYTLMLKYARVALEDLDLTKGLILTRAISLSNAFAYFFTYAFIYNKVLFGMKKNNYLLIPVLIGVGSSLLSTSRTGFMRTIIFIIILSAVLFKVKNGGTNKKTFKIIKKAILGLVMFLIIFTLGGKLTGKGIYNTPLEIISYYAGSSIYLLDKYIVNKASITNDYFGSHTLYGIYNVLRGIGFDIPKFKPPLEMGYIPHFYSNLYTSLRRYIQDFNYSGMLFLQFCVGAIYGGVYSKIKKNNSVGLLLLIYATYFYPVVECAIEERFFIDIMTFTTIVEVLCLIIVYKFFVNNKSNRSVEQNYPIEG